MSTEPLRDAIVGKKSLTAYCGGMRCLFNPHVLGRNRDGKTLVIGYQYAGEGKGGLPAGGAWLRLYLDQIAGLKLNDDPWQPGEELPPFEHSIGSLDVWATP